MVFAESSACLVLIREGLLETINCILLSASSQQTQNNVLLCLKQIFGNRAAKNFLTNLPSSSIVFDLCYRIFSFITQNLKTSAYMDMQDTSDLGGQNTVNLALLVLALASLNNWAGEECKTKLYSEFKFSVILQQLLADDYFTFLGCILAFSVIVHSTPESLSSNVDAKSYEDQADIYHRPISQTYSHLNSGSLFSQNQIVISTDLWHDFVKSCTILLSQDDLYGKAVALACASVCINAQLPFCERLGDFDAIKQNLLLEAIIVSQNSLIDPMWTLNLKVLALTSLESILDYCSVEQTRQIVQLDWFRFLTKQAFISLQSAPSEQPNTWIHWVLLIRILCPHFARSGQISCFNEENLNILQKGTFQSRSNKTLLLNFISIWISILAADFCFIETERLKELKVFFTSVFSDVSGKERGGNGSFLDEAMDLPGYPSETQEECQESWNSEKMLIVDCCMHALLAHKQLEKQTVSGKIVEVMRLLGETRQIPDS
jgi:hypothetical protein